MRTSPLKPRGSYAGAMGMPQFMPSSVVRWGVDYDGDKQASTSHTVADDVIGSSGQLLQGLWLDPRDAHVLPGAPRCRTKLDLDGLLAPDILPTFSVGELPGQGGRAGRRKRMEHKGPLALIELQNGDDPPTYVAGTENFYVITRYNWSSYYAMAVIELGREVKEALARQGKQAP